MLTTQTILLTLVASGFDHAQAAAIRSRMTDADCMKNSTRNSTVSTSSFIPTPNSSNASTGYTLIADYSGSSFFDYFDTFTGADSTHGTVNYTDMRTAADLGLLGFVSRNHSDHHNVNNTHAHGNSSSCMYPAPTLHAYISVDHTTNLSASAGRNSVRLEGKQTFSPGTLAVLDVRHVPVADGTWPAVWFLGDLGSGSWPANGGESDWLEWVHESDVNSMTLHTAPGCVVANTTAPAPVIAGNGTTAFSSKSLLGLSPSVANDMQGTMENTDCNAGNGANGCSVTAKSAASSMKKRSTTRMLQRRASVSEVSNMPTAGHAFNTQGGGVYIHWWTSTGVTVWLFPRHAVPIDLAEGRPEPETWTTTPLARFASASTPAASPSNSAAVAPPLDDDDNEGSATCDFTTSLADLKPIINIDFCGDWAGNVWNSSGAATRTGVSTCAEYVQQHPEAFKDAYFEIASLRVFGQGGGVEVGKAKVTDGVQVEDAATISFPRVQVGGKE